MRHALPRLFLLCVLSGVPAFATTGVCDSNPPTTTQACIDAIQQSGGVVNDIFHDKNGRTAAQLPSFGTLFNVYPACGRVNSGACSSGTSFSPFDCPGQYSCAAPVATLANVGPTVNALDRNWGQPCRLSAHTLVNGCPQYDQCVADGVGGGYFPWEGMVFDLGGPSNQVAIFAENDHGPQPCESAEYTVFLTDNPQSQDLVLQPTTTGADPQKWNRAVLKKVFTKGFVEIRPPDPAGHAACGDTAQYSVEEDSMVTVYGLPCGLNFRYAAVVAGNDGLDFPACAFDSQEAELDAVAGLTEDGAGVCRDTDRDGYVDCNCPGAPAVCDCNDSDPNTHPNAPEACDSPTDLNCNSIHPEPCGAGLLCHAGLCLPDCGGGELFDCPVGSTCEPVDGGAVLCVPTDCVAGGCPPGAVCDTASGSCRTACDATVVCPAGRRCVSGECLDLCRGITCSAGFTCVDGACTPPCSCFSGNVGCTGGAVCDRPTDGGVGTNLCISPGCLGVTCGAGQHCAAGACVDYCSGVVCPANQVCRGPANPLTDGGIGCVNLCAGVHCSTDSRCDFATGQCALVPVDGGVDAGVRDAGLGDGGTRSDGGSTETTDGGAHNIKAGSGCACGAVDQTLGLVFLALAMLRRRAR